GFFPPSGADKGKKLMVQLIAAMLNVAAGNESSCISATIASANTFFANNPPGSALSPAAAAEAVALAATLDAYNNGDMCAAHRDD
ncbi:hypothetical protein, partial [Leclercia adecarboxylata]|uniref:hypothetical protein n=1 Tax=Leclercia adecarboxylata TaxID=83655 RepID=UPI00234D1ED5